MPANLIFSAFHQSLSALYPHYSNHLISYILYLNPLFSIQSVLSRIIALFSSISHSLTPMRSPSLFFQLIPDIAHILSSAH
jgi:hypothetical protein